MMPTSVNTKTNHVVQLDHKIVHVVQLDHKNSQAE